MNQLSKAKSPYLQQHANNPVHWYEWGNEALLKAKHEKKPLLISIGYAACHWCHVMEKQSFMDDGVADIMNKYFVCIKVDREERPDIDQIYMNAALMINGTGGWPLNAFALPDGRPYYAGTYFSKEQWKDILVQLVNAFTNEYAKVLEYAENLTKGIREYEVILKQKASTFDFTVAQYRNLFENLRNNIDTNKGGFNSVPKFPLPVAWSFLLQYNYLAKEKNALNAVIKTLDAMARGGIYDQIGGGFARYSVDADWFAPHFEKMLYDNAQLVCLYANAFKITKNEEYAIIIGETLDFIHREMLSPEGGFYSSLNADSEGEEGKFYVWKHKEFRTVLGGNHSALVGEYFNVKENGNWEKGNNILHRNKSFNDFVEEHQLEPSKFKLIINEARKKLLNERSNRVRPSTDDKILCSWNALMLKAYVEAYLALGKDEYLSIALRNADFIEKNLLQNNGSLYRNFKDGNADISAFLDDYANLVDALVLLYQATFNIHWMHLAKELVDYTIKHFQNPNSSMFYYTPDNSDDLIARKMEITDNVIPSSNSVMANVLCSIGVLYSDEKYIDIARKMLSQVADDVSKSGPYYTNWAKLLGLFIYTPIEVAIGGEEAITKNLEIQKNYLPTSFFCGGIEENLPLLKNRIKNGVTNIFICRNQICQLPLEKSEEALEKIKENENKYT